ncbi:single-strand DNA endonuclease 1 [Cornus florida]|uniref:single-strand DNA endonuclease 1 n=1 Tax=Cornus florida TaxID=4283 RepID=UPI00289A3769|nr:single-strand DNA endonuclease 1 [Cornus florida]
MGVKNLWDILEPCKKILPLHHLQNKRVCIDLSCWIVQLQNVNKSHCSMKDKLYLRGLFHRIRALIALNCSIIFVTDGSIPAIKISAYRQRLKSRSEVTRDETNSQNVTSLRRNMGSEFSCMVKEAKVLGMALGIPCLDGIEEGEAQCALLNSESLCDGCFSLDSDVFLFGARTVYRDICLGEGGYVVCYEMADIEKKLGFGRNSLITLAILLGSDYSQGLHRLGPESACQIVKSVGDNVVLQKMASQGLSFAKKSKGSRKQGPASRCNNKENCLDYEMNNNTIVHNSQRNNQFLQVIDAYLKPKCHSADSNAVNRVLALYPFQRSKVQQLCAQFFEWPPEKTDEYILPKIAERDLRRFSNLRATSSELGLRLPLDKMPVNCPISGIIKQRKLQGRECFEVSWEEIDGLKTSVVPADLIESACPERILEFEERRAQGKKPKPRRKKTEDRTSMKDIDLKLQELLLDIEQGSRITHKASLLTGAIPAKEHAVAAVDLMNQELLHGTESKGSIKRNDSISYYPASSSVAETEVIDLLSPLPPNITKCEKPTVQCIDVIDLGDSEIETSPEHARKARELRLFLASIEKASLD